ncbi:hypothetical protein [Mycoplasma zalophi]|uniref:Uncharacterized protein n=1 Tax=Mycoplasma zalophi TaxID=191287 RepID=A0ABS6DQQ5_9MOLU|nr:hypothetical protein [Mycoplasma zalophi]MBU4691245.1 hypothetical protein [Mycoplasma zalophi]MBU4692549.1 hypothetical protein [Mycoplasma zalophi]
MGLKTRDLRQNKDAIETSITQLLKDFAKFKKEPRFINYDDNHLLSIYKNIVWMSEVDRKTMNKLEEIQRRQRNQYLQNKAKEYEYKKWSDDPNSTKVKEIQPISRLIIAASAISVVIFIALLILVFTKWVG